MFRQGQQIGNYTLVQRLGRGGFGEVWLAERRAKFVTTKVAVKLPLEENVDTEAIKSEAVLWEQASGHPNVLPIIDADEYDGQIVIVSEYAPDGSLEGLLQREGALPVKKAVQLAIGILSGLEYLHSKKIIHRDIKPANILLQGETPRLGDFGISRVMKTTSISINISGTPAYMAPEAFDRKRNRQTDIWSVGVILYQMLMGRLPFPHSDLTELLGAIVRDQPDPLPEQVPRRLQEIVLRSLAKNPDERYQHAREMRSDLSDFLTYISHQSNQPTWKKEELWKTQPVEQMASKQPSPKLSSPLLAADTPKQEAAETLAFNQILGTPSLTLPKPQRKPFRNKLLIPISMLVFLSVIVGSYFLLISGRNSINYVNVELIPYRKGDRFGFVNSEKKLIIPAKYDFVLPFKDGLARVSLNGKMGFIDKNGVEVITLKYDNAWPFEEGMAPVLLSGKVGYIDKTGKEVIPPLYDGATPFSEGMGVVQIGKKDGENTTFGVVDKTGKFVIPMKKYTSNLLGAFHDGLARVSDGFINTSGAQVIHLDATRISSFSEGFAVALIQKAPHSECLVIDKNGQKVLSFDKCDSINPVGTGIVVIEVERQWQLFDTSGKQLAQLDGVEYVDMFSEGLASIKKSGIWGYIDKTGREVIAPKYDFAYPFEGGVAKVQLGSKEFYISQTGVEYFEP